MVNYFDISYTMPCLSIIHLVLEHILVCKFLVGNGIVYPSNKLQDMQTALFFLIP